MGSLREHRRHHHKHQDLLFHGFRPQVIVSEKFFLSLL